MEQQSKKRNGGNRGLSAGLPRYDACIALVSIGIRQEKQWLAMPERPNRQGGGYVRDRSQKESPRTSSHWCQQSPKTLEKSGLEASFDPRRIPVKKGDERSCSGSPRLSGDRGNYRQTVGWYYI
ncbi:hypothetical protein Q5692_25805 [Microcoleus sp. C2C3]|uniref:hypothetical protein n=1 Tax=unclassified Microcoleus TaxID=2642155 RepID=UPI002FD34C8A